MDEAATKKEADAGGAPQGDTVWSSSVKVVVLLAIGTGAFYLLGRMSDKVRGVEQEAAQVRKDREEGAAASGREPVLPKRAAIPEMPRMAPYPKATSFAGGDTFLLNGIPRRIATFGTSDAPDCVAEWYVSAWKAAGLEPAGSSDATYAGWSALDCAHDLRYSIIARRVDEASSTVAYLSVSTVSAVEVGFPKSEIPFPKGSVPNMEVRSEDAGSPGNMTSWIVPLPTDRARRHFREALPPLGWKYEENYSHEPDENGYSVLFFSHGERFLTLTIDPAPDGNTCVVVNESMDLK